MPSSYRVEVSPNNRAGCQDSVCKANGVKIMKGEIRFGTWVTMPNSEHGSWRWKHWGCVSGAQIQGMRDSTSAGGDGEYDWDLIDGYDELENHPEVQEKIRRVVEQGFIDPDDFKGDPEYNSIGQRGIRGRAKKVMDEGEGDQEETSSPKKVQGKRAKVEADNDDEPPKKKAKSSKKAKNKASDEDYELTSKKTWSDDKDEVSLIKIKGSKMTSQEESDPKDDVPLAKIKASKMSKKALPVKAKGYKKATVEDAKDVDLPLKPTLKKASKAAAPAKDEDEPVVTKTSRASKRGKRSLGTSQEYKLVPSNDEDEEDLPIAKPKVKKSGGKKAAATLKVYEILTSSDKEDKEEPEQELSIAKPKVKTTGRKMGGNGNAAANPPAKKQRGKSYRLPSSPGRD